MALVHHLPVATTCLPSFPLSSQRAEDLAPGLQFNMCIKVICGSCHEKSAVQGTGWALLVPPRCSRETNLQAPNWTLSQGQQRERAFCLRKQKSTGDNEYSVSHGKRVGVSYRPKQLSSVRKKILLWKRRWQARWLWGPLHTLHPTLWEHAYPFSCETLFMKNVMDYLAHCMSRHVGTESREQQAVTGVCAGGWKRAADIWWHHGYIVRGRNCKEVMVESWTDTWSRRVLCARLVAPVSVIMLLKDNEKGSEGDVALSATYWGIYLDAHRLWKPREEALTADNLGTIRV